MTFYEVNEAALEPKPVMGVDLQPVQALTAKNGAPVVARDAGTSTSRPLYGSASGGTPLTQPIVTVNGRIEAYVQGETPVDFLINYGLSNQYTQRFTPPQVGPMGPPGTTNGWVVANTVSDNTVDDTAAIIAALDALPDYGGGVGSGVVIIPPTPTNQTKVTAPIPLSSGQTLWSGGFQAVNLLGNFAGPVIDVQVGALYPRLDSLYVKNLSANAAAMALSVPAGSTFSARNVHFHAVSVGGVIAHLNGGLLADFDNCEFAGFGAGACDHAILAEGGSNVLKLRGGSVRDTKGGIVAKQLHYLSIENGVQFESLAGGPSDGYYGAVAVSDVRGGRISGYFEAIQNPCFASFGAFGWSRGLDIGPFYVENCTGISGYAINLANVSHSRVRPCAIYPGSLAPNLGGVDNTGTLAHTNDVSANQYIDSGTGLPVLGGAVNVSGLGSPEGAVSAYTGSTFRRTDAPDADHVFHFKGSGTGNTGWKRLTSSGYVAA